MPRRPDNPCNRLRNMPRSPATALVGLGLALVSLAASAFFFWVWYGRYLSRDFNELGRFYDAECQCVYTTAGMVWVMPAVGFLLMGIVLLALGVRRARARKALAAQACSSRPG
jgi:hypothetical protein